MIDQAITNYAGEKWPGFYDTYRTLRATIRIIPRQITHKFQVWSLLSCVVTHWYTRVTNNHNKVMHPVYIKHLFYKRFSEEETCSKHQKMGVSSPTWQVKHGAVAKNPSVMQQNLAQLNFEHCLKQNHTYWNYLSIMLELFSLVECSKVTSYKLFFKKKEIDHFQKEIFPDDFCI